jgi:predicted amidophosphoribosyltransferase
VFSVGVHAGGLRRAVVRYKYGGERWWAGVFARILAGYLGRRAPWLEEFDVLIPMPAYTGPGARRSWDPVAEIVGELEALIGSTWCIESGLVVKASETPPMSGGALATRQRIATGALRSALAVPDAGRVASARILVVDDVLAEGSTLREVARALRRAGAAEVAGLVLARPDWQGDASVAATTNAPGPGARRR